MAGYPKECSEDLTQKSSDDFTKELNGYADSLQSKTVENLFDECVAMKSQVLCLQKTMETFEAEKEKWIKDNQAIADEKATEVSKNQTLTEENKRLKNLLKEQEGKAKELSLQKKKMNESQDMHEKEVEALKAEKRELTTKVEEQKRKLEELERKLEEQTRKLEEREQGYFAERVGRLEEEAKKIKKLEEEIRSIRDDRKEDADAMKQEVEDCKKQVRNAQENVFQPILGLVQRQQELLRRESQYEKARKRAEEHPYEEIQPGIPDQDTRERSGRPGKRSAAESLDDIEPTHDRVFLESSSQTEELPVEHIYETLESVRRVSITTIDREGVEKPLKLRKPLVISSEEKGKEEIMRALSGEGATLHVGTFVQCQNFHTNNNYTTDTPTTVSGSDKTTAELPGSNRKELEGVPTPV